MAIFASGHRWDTTWSLRKSTLVSLVKVISLVQPYHYVMDRGHLNVSLEKLHMGGAA
jgi:hypothetical protein